MNKERDKPSPGDLYGRVADFEALLRAHRKVRRGKRFQGDVVRFEMELNRNLHTLTMELAEGVYKPQGYAAFVVREPKVRRIHTLPYRDRVVQRALCDEVLVPAIEPRLAYDCAACRRGKGVHFALDRLTSFLREHHNRHGSDGWILKGDIASYFASIDRETVKRMLRRLFRDERVLSLLQEIIDGAPPSPTGPGRGLPLGNMTSQWFANLYLNPLDRLVKERMQVRGYSRYLDDFLLIHHDRAYLDECLRHIRVMLERKLHLSLNHKTQIFPLRHGVDYLGFHTYLTESGKVVRVLRRDSVQRVKRKLKKFQEKYREGEMTMEDIEHSLYSWLGHAEQGDTWKLRNAILNKYIFSRERGIME